MSEKKRKSQLALIFVTVFIYLLGFGVIIPLIPLLSRDFGADATQTGLLMAIFSFMQFVFSPFWGRLSDRWGRRPVLLFCLMGEGLAYILFAMARQWELLLLSRALAGFFGASISTANAYISDITPEHSRSKGMALIGMAFGLGFVFGPAIGGGIAYLAHQWSTAPHFATTVSALFVSMICFLNFIFALKFLPESYFPKAGVQGSAHILKAQRWKNLLQHMRLKTVGPLVIIYFLLSLAMASMESTLILYMADFYNWDLRQTSLGFAFIGVMMVITQGFLVRKVIPRWGEARVLLGGAILFSIGMSGLAWGVEMSTLAMAVSLLAIGIGLSNPSILGSVSLLTAKENQGVTLGVTQSLSSLGRILGPLIGGILYTYWPHSPFWAASGFGVVAIFILVSIFSNLPKQGQKKEA